MDDVDRMSAAQLRSRLQDFGLPLMPVTASTRPVIVKKLRALIAAADESDVDVTGAPMPPPPPQRPKRRKSEPPQEEPKPRRAPPDDYETGSDSELEPLPLPRRYSPVKSTFIPSSSSVYSSEDIAENLNSIRSRLGLSQPLEKRTVEPSYTSRYVYSSYKSQPDDDEVETPYFSNFSKRLSTLTSKFKDQTKTNDFINGSDTYESRPLYSTAYKRRGDTSQDFKKAGEKNTFKNNLVSLGIVGLGIAFFLVISFTYVGMKNDMPFDPLDGNNVIPICTNSADRHPRVNCVLKQHMSIALDLLKLVHPELIARAVGAKCASNEQIYMSEDDVVQFVSKTLEDRSADEIKTDFYNAQVLVMNNPRWGISNVMINPLNGNDDLTPLTSMDYVVPLRPRKQIAFAVLSPSVPLKCILFDKLYTLLSFVFLVGFVLVTAYLVHRAIKAYRAYRKKMDDDVYSMVEQIIDYLCQENADEVGCDQPVPVNHIRDVLIPPQNRDKLAKVWNGAIKFLEQNESRVRFEVDVMNGEHYRSLRWVSPQGSPRSTRGGGRVWQGQAFETQTGSVNNLPYSPTSCLKIRHMFDRDEKNPDLKMIIADAILEKCGPACRILHIEIDKVSCCVFVKCASPADAGIVYKNLHGWWYEGNLITVKYLRLERYMDHFPNSPSTGPYLKPSTAR